MPLDAYVWQLSVGEQQRIELLRLLHRQAEILILDEPTAVLTPQEADALMIALRRMANNDKAIILITHKIKEVLGHAEPGDDPAQQQEDHHAGGGETTPLELTRAMLGREMNGEARLGKPAGETVVLQVDALQVPTIGARWR